MQHTSILSGMMKVSLGVGSAACQGLVGSNGAP